MLVALIAVLGAATGLLTLLYRILAERRRTRGDSLTELQTKFDRLPPALDDGRTAPDADFKQLVDFLTLLAKRRDTGEVKLSEIDRRFGEWFFKTLHSDIGVKVALEAKSFDKLKDLYTAWYKYRVRRKEPIDSPSSFAAQRWAVHTRAHTNKGRILWHHALHEEVGEATLIFWRLRFEPRYNSREILDFIETVCEDFSVDSYVVYELLGPHDLMLRCWLSHADSTEPVNRSSGASSPSAKRTGTDQPQTRIEQMTSDLEVSPQGATERCDYFRVEHILRHWWWHDKRLWTRREPNRTLDKSVVLDIKTCKDKEAVEQLANQYNAGKIGLRDVLLNRAARGYRKKNYMRWRRLRDGIKFATIIRVKDDTSAYEDARLYIENLVAAASGISDRSLYEGSGFDERNGPAHFLILGRVRSRKFEKIRKQIIKPVVETEAIAEHCTPTLTYVVTGPEVMRRTYKDQVKQAATSAPEPAAHF